MPPVISKDFEAEYDIEPTADALRAMSASELARVCGLKISRRCGSITFIDAIDCRGLDFAKVFAIHGREGKQRQGVTVRGDVSDQFKSTRAMVTLYDVCPTDKHSDAAKFRKKLVKACDAQGTTFESYDESERSWSFRVEHF